MTAQRSSGNRPGGCLAAGGSRAGGSAAADDRNESAQECLVADGVADLRADTERGQEVAEPAGIDEHVVVGFVVTTQSSPNQIPGGWSRRAAPHSRSQMSVQPPGRTRSLSAWR